VGRTHLEEGPVTPRNARHSPNPQQVRLSTEESADCINVQLFDCLDHPGFRHEPGVYAFFGKLLAPSS
jgi:hypothetical protein